MALYLETSALLSILFQEEKSQEAWKKLIAADRVLSSRLLKVETQRAILRVTGNKKQGGEKLRLELETNLKMLLTKIDFVEITKTICDKAGNLVPSSPLRSLDAIHLATYFWLAEKNPNLEMLSFDERIKGAI